VKIWGVSEAAIVAAVSEAGLTVWGDWRQDGSHRLDREGRALHVRLCVDKTKPRDEAGLLPFQKRGRDFPGRRGRRTPYVTWEGHREFMRLIFRDHPEARIKSAVADYRGREEFWAKHPETRGRFEGTPLHF
jgi:hypothetical protein